MLLRACFGVHVWYRGCCRALYRYERYTSERIRLPFVGAHRSRADGALLVAAFKVKVLSTWDVRASALGSMFVSKLE